MLNQKILLSSLLIILLLCSIPAVTWGQSKVGTTAAPFLTIGVGSRPIGMGGAYVSMYGDAYSLYWNPAALARLEHSDAVLVHTQYLADMTFNFAGAAFVLGDAGVLGISTTLLDVGEMEVTTEAEQDGTGIYFNCYDLAMAMSYSYMFYDKFSIGGTFKYIHQQIWHESANAVAIDLGTLLITPLHDIRLGMNISNFGTDMRMSGKDLLVSYDPATNKQGNNDNIFSEIQTSKWSLPMTMRVGISGEPIDTPRERLTLAMDWVHPNDNTEFIDAGCEYAFMETFMLRFGYKAMRPSIKNNDGIVIELSPRDSGGGLTFGGGLNIKINQEVSFKIDYAYESYDRLGNIHKYSMGLGF